MKKFENKFEKVKFGPINLPLTILWLYQKFSLKIQKYNHFEPFFNVCHEMLIWAQKCPIYPILDTTRIFCKKELCNS